MDEGSYPSGFVGGNITRSHPELRMQALEAGERVTVRGGQHVSIAPPDNLVAVNATDHSAGKALDLAAMPSTTLEWTAPTGNWEVVVVQNEFRTSPTRYVHTPGFAKDRRYSFFDPLNPAGSRQFLADVHEQVRRV